MQEGKTILNPINTLTGYQDGDTHDMYNLKKRGGSLMPYSLKFDIEQYYTVLDGTIVHAYQHNTSTTKNLIAITTTGSLYHLKDTAVLIGTVGLNCNLNAVGNILTVAGDTKMRYFLFRDSEYREVVLDASTLAELVDLRVSLKRRNGNTEFLQFSSEALELSTRNDDNRMREIAKGLFEKARAKVSELGYLNDFHLAITAVELFDGSFVYHSIPVLLGQTGDEMQRHKDKDVRILYKEGGQYLTRLEVADYELNPMAVVGWDGIHIINHDNYNSFENDASSLTMMAGVDGHYSFENNPNRYQYYPIALIYTTTNTTSNSNKRAYVNIWQNILQYRVRKSLSAEIAEFVKSISVFLSAPSSMYNFAETETKVLKSGVRTVIENSERGFNNVRPKLRSNQEIIEDLFKSIFYKVAEIDVSGGLTASGTWHDLNLKDKLGDNLYVQQTLPIDSGRHLLKANKQYSYNNRLHLYDYSEKFWDDFYRDMYSQEVGEGQFNAGSTHNLGTTTSFINVDLKTDSGETRLVKTFDNDNRRLIPDAAVIAYPDRRATRIIIYHKSNMYKHKKIFNLTPSTEHNFAYYIHGDLKTQKVPYVSGSPEIIPDEENTTIHSKNTLKVSEIVNPFYYPAKNTYQIGSGAILNVGINKMNVSDRNFGSFPLYVLTENGWYSLGQGGDNVLYQAVVPIPTESVRGSQIIETPFGVVFVGDKGLYILNNNESKLLTPHLYEKPFYLSLEAHTNLEQEVKTAISKCNNDFMLYLQGATNFFYDTAENDIYITNSQKDFSYVFNIDGSLSRTDKATLSYVENSFNTSEQFYMFSDKTIYKPIRSRDERDKIDVFFVTRPLLYGTEDIKKLERVVLDAVIQSFDANGKITYGIYTSDDAVNYKLARANVVNVPYIVQPPQPQLAMPHTFKDIDSGLMARTKARYYVVLFYAEKLTPATRINTLRTVINKQYNNTKLR